MSPSASLGIDRLPAAKADDLAGAWLQGALDLLQPSVAWATTAVADPRPGLLEDASCSCTGPGRRPRCGPPDVVGAVVLPRHSSARMVGVGARGAGAHARGCQCGSQPPTVWRAPLHHEGLAARGGADQVVDERTFVETSSLGTRAIDATIRAVGVRNPRRLLTSVLKEALV